MTIVIQTIQPPRCYTIHMDGEFSHMEFANTVEMMDALLEGALSEFFWFLWGTQFPDDAKMEKFFDYDRDNHFNRHNVRKNAREVNPLLGFSLFIAVADCGGREIDVNILSGFKQRVVVIRNEFISLKLTYQTDPDSVLSTVKQTDEWEAIFPITAQWSDTKCWVTMPMIRHKRKHLLHPRVLAYRSRQPQHSTQ
jgi:hypothetical protein